MHKFSFTQYQAKHAIFYRYVDEDALIITVDVDDLTMAGNSKKMSLSFKDQLHMIFKIKDLGDLCWLLGIEVKRDHTK